MDNDQRDAALNAIFETDPLRAATFVFGGEDTRHCCHADPVTIYELKRLNRTLEHNSLWTLIGGLGAWVAIIVAIVVVLAAS